MKTLQIADPHYQSLLMKSAYIVWVVDAEGRILKNSSSWATYTGQHWEEYKDWGWEAVLYPEDRENIRTVWKDASGRGPSCEMEKRIRSSNGEYRYFLIRGMPVFESSGQLQEWIVVGNDIHKYKTAEALLKEKDIALKEMLGQLEIEKKIFLNQIQRNVDKLLLPILRKLKKKTTTIEEKYIELLESNLKELSSPFAMFISELRELTPKEIEICNMIRNGLTTKEVARLLQISVLTVNTHRTSIRKKLKISKRKINLTSYLQTV